MNRLLKSSIAFGLAIASSATAFGEADLSGTWVISKPVSAFMTVDGKLPPLQPKALATYNARLAATKKGDRSWDPVSKCKPPGEPRTFVQDSWPFELMQSPDRIDFLFQWNRLDRAVTINTPEETYQGPTYFGQSTAKWDGDTLVISTMGFKENTSLDPAGLPRTEDMKLTERFRLITGSKNLEARIHIEDPATYTQPWDTVLIFKRMPEGTRIKEDTCIERLKLNDFATMDNALKVVGSQ
jgi:hypothetical protein